MISPDWSEAACKGIDPDTFFPPHGGDAPRYVRHAIAQFCNNCPIRETCLDYSLHHEKFGIWGGKTETQRRAIRRVRGIVLEQPQTMVDCRVMSSSVA